MHNVHGIFMKDFNTRYRNIFATHRFQMMFLENLRVTFSCANNIF